MSKRRQIDVTATSTASADAVYALLAAGNTWPRWTSIESYELEAGSGPTPDGVGEIRIYKRGRTTGRDQVAELVPGRRFAYRALSGLPTRDYFGQVDVEPTATGSTIRWRSSFFPKFPGTGKVMETGIRRFLDECVRGLAQYAATPEQAVS